MLIHKRYNTTLIIYYLKKRNALYLPADDIVLNLFFEPVG
jgi:hypothetical protein